MKKTHPSLSNLERLGADLSPLYGDVVVRREAPGALSHYPHCPVAASFEVVIVSYAEFFAGMPYCCVPLLSPSSYLGKFNRVVSMIETELSSHDDWAHNSVDAFTHSARRLEHLYPENDLKDAWRRAIKELHANRAELEAWKDSELAFEYLQGRAVLEHLGRTVASEAFSRGLERDGRFESGLRAAHAAEMFPEIFEEARATARQETTYVFTSNRSLYRTGAQNNRYLYAIERYRVNDAVSLLPPGLNNLIPYWRALSLEESELGEVLETASRLALDGMSAEDALAAARAL